MLDFHVYLRTCSEIYKYNDFLLKVTSLSGHYCDLEKVSLSAT